VSPARAQNDAFDFFREESKIYIASRRPESAWRAPVAVDVVTAEEIRAYGYRNLADILRYRAGMDVVAGRAADGNRAIVSARGFTRDFVSEMQVLVDGRSVFSPLLGGVYWDSLPVQIQDIERIEIVRGPNAALYGSNAALGVVSIITRKPESKASGRLSASGGNRGHSNSESAEAGGRLGAVRVSHAFEQTQGNPVPNGAGDANDFLHSNRLNLRALLKPEPKTEIEFMGGGAWQTLGVPGFAVDSRVRHEKNYQHLRAARETESAGVFEAGVSRSELSLDRDRFFTRPVNVRIYQYEAELLHRLSWAEDAVESVAGGSWRLSGAYSDQIFSGRPAQQNRIVRGFTHQSVRLTERLTAAAGVSLEDSRLAGLQPAWQAAAIFSLRGDQTLRLSYAHAPTMPALVNKSVDFTLGTTRFVGHDEISPQHLSSWEAGWNCRSAGGALKSMVTLYYMQIQDRIFQFVANPGPPRDIGYDNRNRATARGVELSEEYGFAPGRAVFANYTFEKIQDDKGIDAVGTEARRGTPEHKVNLGGRALLGKGFGAAVLLGYKDAYIANSSTRGTRREIPRSFRLDGRVSWAPRPDWELFFAGTDLLQPYRVETADGTASPRRFEGGVTKRFGL